MVVSTLYSDSQMVIVDIGTTPLSAPWLAQTTYLIDQSGHTTAVLAQTNQPTDGVTLAPVSGISQAQKAVPSTTVSGLPLGWAYQGCYNDVYPFGRVLSLQQPNDHNLTVETCVWSCFNSGYSVSGLELHVQCFCGNFISNGGTLSQWDFDCNKVCSGNSTEICGGNNKLSIYSNRTLTPSQSAAAQTTELPTTAPTIAPSSTGASSRMAIPGTTIAAVVIGAVTGVAIMVALTFYLHRRIKRNYLRTDSPMRTPHLTTHAGSRADRVPSWEEFLKESGGCYAGTDESQVLSIEDNGSGLGIKSTQDGSRPSIPELREKYEQLHRKIQQSSHSGWRSSDTFLASPARYPSSERAPSRAQLDQPMSILKRPTPTENTNMAQSMAENEDEQASKGIPATTNLALAKKCVRFGVNQIREFGRSPFIGHGSNASEP